MRGVRLTLVVAATIAASGCPSIGAYFCGDDTDCDRGDQAGVCLDDNSCAYPDTTGMCDSGLVRSPNADRDPGQCVPTGASGGQTDGGSSTGDATEEGIADEPTADTGSAEGPAVCGSVVEVTVRTALLSPDEALPNFPVLLRTADLVLVEALRSADANVSIADASGVPLPLELVQPAADPDAFAAWVRLPDHAAAQELTLQLSWGAEPSANEPTQVWDPTYRGVWHFDDPLTGVDGDLAANAVVAGEPGVAGGSMQPDQAIPAVVGRGWRFDGDDDIVTVDAAFVGTLDSYTISLWARHDDDDDDPWSSYFQRLNGDFFYPRCWRLDGGGMVCQYRNGTDGITPLDPEFVHDMGQTLHLTLVRDGELRRTSVYINGEFRVDADDFDGDLAIGRFPFEIGHGEWGSATALIDEVRVSDRALSSAWIAAEYAAQIDPAAAVTFGAITDADCP